MSLIRIQDLTFAYDGSYDNIFEDVSFQIDTDWKLGFIGRNGRGKTTFLNLLLGKYAYAGSISAAVPFEYFPFPVADTSLPAMDVVAGISRAHLPWELDRELNLLEVDEDVLGRPFATLSNGEQTKLLLAALFLRENSFLLIDEPTNHLDANGRALVSRYLSGKSGFILVSHDRAFLDGCVDHILSINRCGLEVQQGNFSSWLLNRQRRDQFELAENEKLGREIDRLKASAKEKSGWSDNVEKTKYATKNSGLRPDRGHIGHKAAKMAKRSKTMEKRQSDAIAKKATLLKNLEKAPELKITQMAYPARRLASLRDVSIAYGEKSVCQHVTFTIEAGDRIALSGKNGSGKTSLVKLIRGEDIPFSGQLERGSRLEISYVSQDTSFLQGDLREFARQSRIDESLFKAILRKLDFERVQFEKDMRALSEGQKKKVLIAKSLSESSHLLIWDEPLNFIDVLSRMQIENLLLACKPTLLFVEHDRRFCENIATKVIQL